MKPFPRFRFALLFVPLLVAGCVQPSPDDAPSLPEPSPYAAQLTSPVRGLSAEEVDDLLEGRGMGLARAAELNGYPGPVHVLELAPELALSEEQQARMEDLYEGMRTEARALGRDVVAKHRELEGAFRNRTITPEELEVLVGELDALYRELRLVHLRTHLTTPDVLTHEQMARYHELRGYGHPEGGHAHGNHGGH